MSDVEELERRVAELENFYTDIPEMLNLRLDRNDAAHAEHSARLSIIDKQLAALTRDVRDMRGGVTRQLTGQDQRLAAMEQRMTAMDQRLAAMEQRMTAMDQRLAAMEQRMTAMEQLLTAMEQLLKQRLTAFEQRQQAFETTMTQRLDGVDAQLSRVITMLEKR